MALFLLLLVALPLVMLWASGMGYMSVPVSRSLLLVKALVTGGVDVIDPVIRAVVFDVRLPRILAAVLVGGALAVAGAVFQSVLLNPLADPYTLGVSSGAAFGASLAIVFQLFNLLTPSLYQVPLFSFLGSSLTLVLVLYLASSNGSLSVTNLILAGVIVGAILSAAIGFLKFLADEQVGIIIFWLMGSLAGVSWIDMWVLLGVVICGLLVCMFYSRELNIMATGERSALALGVDTVRLRWLLLMTCSLMSAVCVSMSGIIGFVGLIIPHLLRYIVGPDNRWLIILSFLAGGLLLLVADTVTRAVLPVEVPIGVLTALIGGPFFCFIFKKNQHKGRGGF